MGSDSDGTAHFRLFDSAGVGLAGLDENNVILQVNDTLTRYLEIEAASALGQNASVLADTAASPEFWRRLTEKGSFYALIPGRHHLLLGTALAHTDPSASAVSRMVLLRPYSLEREFMRMRSRLNQNVAFEISEHLSSLAVAGEIILQPELQQDETTRERFLQAFLGDIQDLSGLFNELQDIAEPVPFPNRVHFVRVDYKSLLADMIAKMNGFVAEKNVSVSHSLLAEIPSVEGDRHWLSLALYGILAEVLGSAPALEEVAVNCTAGERSIETTVSVPGTLEGAGEAEWPPRTLFPVPAGETRLGPMKFTALAVSRCILLTHGGDLTLQQTEEGDQLTVSLPV